MVFLSETKSKVEVEVKLKRDLNLVGGFSMPSKGRNEGLMILWDEEVDLSINSYSEDYINVTVKEKDGRWRFTCFYGNSIASKRGGGS